MSDKPKNPTALWDDNPATIDLLGFDAVVAPIIDATLTDDLDPLTIGVHARWGGGKSTLLGLIASELDAEGSVIVIRTNPWEYDDHDDVKGTLIAEVLDSLEQQFKKDGEVAQKVKDLFKRISWARVGKVVAKSVVLQTADLKGLAEALTPKGRGTPESMAGFRASFAELVDYLPNTDRVVVLVDDLDRCLPPAVTATLEAIKLFLSVRGMVFVIAADQNMVRDAIALNLGQSPEASRYAQRYLDKIVQLPVSLPVLPPHEAEAYVGLLLARTRLAPDDYDELVAHVYQRRVAGKIPLLAEMSDLKDRPTAEEVRLASQLVHGLRSDTVVNPREIKRFMNAYMVRRRIAQVRGVNVRADVLAKLMILEDRLVDDFKLLLNTPELERPALLDYWSKWARGDDAERPEGVSDRSRAWAASEPELATEPIGPYLTLAASFASERTSDVVLDAELATLISDMSSASEAARREAVKSMFGRNEDDQSLAVEGLFGNARLRDNASPILASLVALAEGVPILADQIADRLFESHLNQIDVGIAVELAQSQCEPLKTLAGRLVDHQGVDVQVVQAIRNVSDDGES